MAAVASQQPSVSLKGSPGVQEEAIAGVYDKEWDSIFRNLNYKINVNFHGQKIISKRICSQ